MLYPCKGCEERYPGCHDHCEAYLKVKHMRDEAVAEERKYADARNHVVELVNKNKDHDNKRLKSGRHHMR